MPAKHATTVKPRVHIIVIVYISTSAGGVKRAVDASKKVERQKHWQTSRWFNTREFHGFVCAAFAPYTFSTTAVNATCK
jgi:hypothetical protein